jgi:hypothetical protein
VLDDQTAARAEREPLDADGLIGPRAGRYVALPGRAAGFPIARAVTTRAAEMY